MKEEIMNQIIQTIKTLKLIRDGEQNILIYEQDNIVYSLNLINRDLKQIFKYVRSTDTNEFSFNTSYYIYEMCNGRKYLEMPEYELQLILNLILKRKLLDS